MNQYNIAIVEDEIIIAKGLASNLIKEGVNVIGIVSNYEELIELINKASIDIILLDIHLKNSQDGLEIAKNLCYRYDIPILFLTAYDEKQLIEKAKLDNVYGYLLKPINLRELLIAIDFAVYKHRTNQELILLNNSLEKKIKEKNEDSSFFYILDNLPIGILILNNDFSLSFINKFAKKTLDFNSDNYKDFSFNNVFLNNIKNSNFENDLQLLYQKEILYNRVYYLKNDRIILTNLSLIKNQNIIEKILIVFFYFDSLFLNIIYPDENFYKKYDLTQREIDILKLIFEGKKSKDISQKLFISEGTVKIHIQNIYSKMNINSKDDLFLLYVNYLNQTYNIDLFIYSLIRKLFIK